MYVRRSLINHKQSEGEWILIWKIYRVILVWEAEFLIIILKNKIIQMHIYKKALSIGKS